MDHECKIVVLGGNMPYQYVTTHYPDPNDELQRV